MMAENPVPERRTERTRGGLAGVHTASPTEQSPDDAELANARLALEIDQLALLDLDELRLRYRQLTRKAAPAHLPKWLLLRMVAYRLQANRLGDLDAETVRILERIARDHARAKAERNKDGAEGGKYARDPRLHETVAAVPGRLRPGTQLVREFNGDFHRVVVLDAGFSWEGRVFTSLSEIARAITGTSWNGPAFFGLRPRSNTKASTIVETASAAGGAP